MQAVCTREAIEPLLHLTGAEAARILGVSRSTTNRAANKFGLSFNKDAARKINSENMTALNKREGFNSNLHKRHLNGLTPQEAVDYKFLRSKRYTRAEALTALGRPDLLEAA